MAQKFNGRDFGLRLVKAMKDFVNRKLESRLSPVEERVDAALAELKQLPSASHVQALIDLALGRVQMIPGPPGESITLEDVQPFLETAVARMERDAERRITDRCDSAIGAAITALRQPEDGKDGANGINGENGENGLPGNSVEDFAISINGRELTLSVKIGGEVFEKTARVNTIEYKGIYRNVMYESGDVVTHSGSAFIAVRPVSASEKPEASEGWKLFVKRGRDGKDAAE